MTICDILVDIVLRMWCIGMLLTTDEMAEAQEVRHVSGRDGDRETVRISAMRRPEGGTISLSSRIKLISRAVHCDRLPLDNVTHEVGEVTHEGGSVITHAISWIGRNGCVTSGLLGL